jgi:hypothetical protein
MDAVLRMSDEEYQAAVGAGKIPDIKGAQPFTAEQLEIAALVAKRTSALVSEGVVDDQALLAAMQDLVPDLKRILLDVATPAMLNELCTKYGGFHYFIVVLFGRGPG